MQRILIFIFSLTLISIACNAATPSAPSTETSAPPAVVFATFTSEPTRMPAATRAPASTPTPAGEFYAWNYIAEMESGGVSIQIARLALADKAAAVNVDFEKVSTFDDRPVVAAIIFIVKNNSDKTISVFPDQGTVIAGGEQIDLREFMLLGTFGDDVGGEIFSGVTKIGGIWLGFKRTPVEAIQSMIIAIQAPVDQNFSTLGPEYRFDLDLSQRKNEPVPDELK